MDRYNLGSVVLIVIVLILSIVDAFLTLELVSMGAEELNPVMAFFLQYGPMPFLLAKYILTATGLTALLVLKSYPVFRERVSVKAVLVTIPIVYLVLIGYEVLLIDRILSASSAGP